ncbi:hypothetical protein C922_02016 [Plasmodium inui San Antonio 1]|uniref:P-loop containing nucleoside triphosphate hydrolase n=1 Tax=Plasmodium inui San Antonio 1 TaxID=1237626 RepID=W7A3K5_9APIC|nr:hypothetical protein C922_02016 [Plasmodium inui San Antonio 1]EUD67827.1 hypothetical protein C922_02016 [Plasmodium inui San Antonio 1]
MNVNKSANVKSGAGPKNGELDVDITGEVKGPQKFRFVIEHIDFCLFCKKKKEKNEDATEGGGLNHCGADGAKDDSEDDDGVDAKEGDVQIDPKRLSFIGKTYDFLKKKSFNPKHLKRLENAQYFEKVLWAHYNIYERPYLLKNNEVFFCMDGAQESTYKLYIKHILSLIVFICYKYEEKGKYEIWDQIIYNRIDEFEKLVEIERKNYTSKENYKIDERFNMYKEFLVQKIQSLFFNTLKLINYNFVFSEYMRNGKLNGGSTEETEDIIRTCTRRVFKLDFLEKSFVIQFFINIYSSIDKKFLFKLCLDLCNPFIWNCVNYSYLNEFLFQTSKEAKVLYNNLLKVMEKKYLNGRSYNVLGVYTCSCGIVHQDDVKKEEYDEGIILFVNKNEFFYNLINYFLIVLDIFEGESEEMDDLASDSSISSRSDTDSENEELDECEKYLEMFNDEEGNIPNEDKSPLSSEKLGDDSVPVGEGDTKEIVPSNDNAKDDMGSDASDKGGSVTDDSVDDEEEGVTTNGHSAKRAKRVASGGGEAATINATGVDSGEDGVRDEVVDFLESVEAYAKYIYSEDEEDGSYVNHSEHKKEEILRMFRKYEGKLKGKNKHRYNTRKVRRSRRKHTWEDKKFRILFVEKCVEFFIDLLSQLYSRRILYILIKHFNVLIYCKISSLNRKRKFKELIKLLKYYMEMYINNFSGKPLTYLEISNEHYKNFEFFQTFCYKHFKEHTVLKNYYLKSVFLMNKKRELLENLSKLEERELLFLCEKLKYLVREEQAAENANVVAENANHVEGDSKFRGSKWSRDSGRLFQNMTLFRGKQKLFYITVLIENLSFKSNIFEEIDKQCEYPNEKDLFDSVLIDTKDDMKKKRKTFLYTKPLFKLNLQYLCINDYVFRIYNLFKLQSYYDIRKNVLEYVYETNPKNRKVNEHTVCRYVFEMDERSEYNRDDNEMNGEGKKRRRKRKHEGELLGDNQIDTEDGFSSYKSMSHPYNEYQLNSIVQDVNKIENTYFANERRMSNKIDSFKIVNVDNNSKKVTAEIIIDLKYKYYERVNNEWNMIRPCDILFLVCVKNYTNYYKNKINVINDGDLKNLLGINYIRGCEVFKFANFVENGEEGDAEKSSLKRITVYLDYHQYQKDILNDPEIYNSFNLLVRRKQKENNFFYILNNIKTLIMNPDDAVIPFWVHDMFLGYCDGSLKYYQKSLPRRDSAEGDSQSGGGHGGESQSEEKSAEDPSEEGTQSEEESAEDASGGESQSEGVSAEDASGEDSSDDANSDSKNRSGSPRATKLLKSSLVCNREKLNFIRNSIDDINYLNTFINILHVIKTTNVAYLCIDSSYMNVSSGGDKIDVKNLLNEYIEPLFLSYVPIKYGNKKKSLEKDVLQRNILESLYYHICVINGYATDEMGFVSNFVENIRIAYRYGDYCIFQFVFKAKEYFLILNSYVRRGKSGGRHLGPIIKGEGQKKGEEKAGEEGDADEVDKPDEPDGEVTTIDDRRQVQTLFDQNVKRSIGYLSLKGNIYRIPNRIYDDQDYPLEGLLVHTKKRNRSNVALAKRGGAENGADEANVVEATSGGEAKKRMYYTERQIECIKSGLYEGITIIEGVPGSGKTSILNKIINILFNNKTKEKILICTHSNSCLNYIFNLLVKENLIHQKYLCRVGMGELDIENLRAEYEEVERNLARNGISRGNENSIVKKAGKDFFDEDDNFNFSKYGRINYMIDLRQKLLNEVNLLSESSSSQKIYHCLSATQYYENHVKKRIINFFKFIEIYRKNGNEEDFFKSCITASVDDYDVYNLFLCPKVYVEGRENVEDLIWRGGKETTRCTCKEVEKLQILDEDKECFYLIHPEDQLGSLQLSMYSVLFPFKKYLNLKLHKVGIDEYLEYKGGFLERERSTQGGEMEEVEKDAEVEAKQEKGQDAELLAQSGDVPTPRSIFNGDVSGMTFKNNEDDLYVSKYYLAMLIKNFEHLNDCRAFEVLKNQRERGVYIIAKLARVIAMTCTHASINRSKIAKLQFYFDNIIIDECTQITENDTFLPLLLQENRYYKSKLKRIIFVGDSNQLPPIIKNKYIKNFANYEQSLYKRFLRLELPSIYLNEQGRMRNEICNIYKYFYSKYNIQIANLECINRDKFLKNFNPGFTYTYQFIHVESEEYTPVPYFYQNLLEAEMAVAIFVYMRLLGYASEVITILTTYNGQKELILDILKKKCLCNKLIGMPKKVTTVDKYQGKQNDYVIISLVRSRSIGYMKNIKRLIVAFSRARFGLYVVGNYNLYKKNYEFKKPLYFFRKNRLELSLQMNEQFDTAQREGSSPTVIVKDLNHFYSIIYPLANAHLQHGCA